MSTITTNGYFSATAPAATPGATATAASTLSGAASSIGSVLSKLPAEAKSLSGDFARPDGLGDRPVDTLALSRVGASGVGAEVVKQIGKKAATSAVSGGARASVGSAAAAGAVTKLGFAKAFGLSALVSVPISLVSDYIQYKKGNLTAQQRNTLMLSDSVGYAATGAAGSMIGAAIGTTFLGPGFGTILGIGAGMGLSYLYERFLRPHFNAAPAPVAPVAPTSINPLAVK